MASKTDEAPDRVAPDQSGTVPLDKATLDGGTAFVRAGALRRFRELAIELGGDADGLLARAQIDPAVVELRHAVVPFRSFVHLLERTASELSTPDVGMRLAAEQADNGTRGPLEIVMCNSETLGDAYRYCVEHVQAATTGAQLTIEEDRSRRGIFLRFEVLLPRLPYQRQTVEHAMLTSARHALTITAGQIRPREVWFTHEPLAPLSTYRAYFGCPVLFSQPKTGLVFADGDLDTPVPNVDPQLYELATTFIEHRYPSREAVLSMRVRTIVERLLLAGDCTFAGVASALGVHPRTLQRRLRAEGFEMIKDGVRRDIALRYLRQSAVPLVRVAEILGYSETSVLSRSCNRWFSASPRQLRAGRELVTKARGPAQRRA
jgi:AraC-like DNA-binding protein